MGERLVNLTTLPSRLAAAGPRVKNTVSKCSRPWFLCRLVTHLSCYIERIEANNDF